MRKTETNTNDGETVFCLLSKSTPAAKKEGNQY